jgi:hypothetical protein
MEDYKIYFNNKKGAMCKKSTSFEILSVGGRPIYPS